ncbi:MarR family winged helix-turn-helix transcriptional regulator [Arthrobacter sp. PAMC 25486]|uniref:MarR family winged helix-turn-helix transcriptional regulator n=1 Tax=Arthrobacter sp. PAMC 25486 TaxID=1494608 RepID=UPI00068DFD14|nr:MarR family winged helix-turn-helix transcriptional regulator [Arthrobacter sp. PAMC 25486]
MSNSTTTAQPNTSPKEDFGWTLGVLVRNYQNASTAAMGEFPQGSRGYQVLVAVVSGEQPNQLALAQHLGIDRTVMTYLVDDFVKAGLVERQLNPADRRARIVVATELGLAMLADLQQRVATAENAVLGALADEERELFRTLLRRVACDTPPVSEHDLGACAAVEEMLGTGK